MQGSKEELKKKIRSPGGYDNDKCRNPVFIGLSREVYKRYCETFESMPWKGKRSESRYILYLLDIYELAKKVVEEEK